MKRISDLHGKPDIVRVVSEIGLILLTYSGQSLLLVELIKIDNDFEERKYLDIAKEETETGSICDIVIRDDITLKGSLHERVVLVAMNTEPPDNKHFHIGNEITLK